MLLVATVYDLRLKLHAGNSWSSNKLRATLKFRPLLLLKLKHSKIKCSSYRAQKQVKS